MPLSNTKSTSSLTAEEAAKIRNFLDGQQPFCLYFNAALADVTLGLDNRWFHIDHNGVIFGIDFEEMQVVTIIGDVHENLIKDLSYPTRRTEFHVNETQATIITNLARERVVRTAHLNYYMLQTCEPFEVDESHIRLLSPADRNLLEPFYASYDARIFSSWMLEKPFVGLFIDNQLASAGGTIIIDEQAAAANVGNFLTHPLYRRRKYSQMVLKSLINKLLDQDITTFTLGTTEENLPACRAYESVGFRVTGRRIELEVIPSANAIE